MAKEVKIDLAPEVEAIATSLIREFHPELLEACILYLMTTAAAKCSPEKCNPKVRYFASREVKGVVKAEVAAGPDFIVWVNDLEYAFYESLGKLQPWIAHRIEHMSVEVDGEGIPHYVLKTHPLEEFPEIVQRFGAWSDELRQVRDILQPELDFGREPVGTNMVIEG